MTSCAPTLSSVNPEGAVRIAQAAFKPITWSRKDTPVTVQQIKVHNEVGVKLGIWNKPAAAKQNIWLRRPIKKQKVADVPLKPAEDTTWQPAARVPAHWWSR